MHEYRSKQAAFEWPITKIHQDVVIYHFFNKPWFTLTHNQLCGNRYVVVYGVLENSVGVTLVRALSW